MIVLVSFIGSACGPAGSSVAPPRKGSPSVPTSAPPGTLNLPVLPNGRTSSVPPVTKNGDPIPSDGGTSYVLPTIVPPGDTHDYGGSLPPSSYSVGIDVVMEAAYNAGFHSENLLVAVTAIAIEESTLNPMARHYHLEYGPDQYDRGLWQISTHWFPRYTDAQCDDPSTAAAIVYTISSGGSNFAPWDAYTNGSAQTHYDQAIGSWPAVRPLVKQFLAKKS